MSIAKKILRRFGYVPMRSQAPGFSSAAIGRLLNDWTTSTLSVDSEIRKDLPKLRARTRESRNNDDYAKKYIRMLLSNVLGHCGMHCRVKAKDPDRIVGNKVVPGALDKGANKAVEEAWYQFGLKENCTVAGDTRWCDVERITLESLATDGESITRIVRGFPGNKFNFALQIMETDQLDTELNKGRDKDGNEIRMGVEFNIWRRPVAYWFLTENPNDSFFWAGSPMPRYERIAARDIIHPFVKYRPFQTRGVPWLATPLETLYMLRKYENYELIASRVASGKMGFFESTGDVQYSGEDDGLGNKIMEAEGGAFEILPQGLKLATWDPQHPNANFTTAVKQWLRRVASALGVSYNTLANDMESVNFASGKLGLDEERDMWRCVQNWFSDHYHEDIFSAWLEHSLMFGKIKLGNGSDLPFSKFDKFNAAYWQGRRWSFVNPQQEVAAIRDQLRLRLTSISRVLAEKGIDRDELFEEIAADKEALEALDLTAEDIFADHMPATDEKGEPLKPAA